MSLPEPKPGILDISIYKGGESDIAGVNKVRIKCLAPGIWPFEYNSAGRVSVISSSLVSIFLANNWADHNK